MPIYEYECTACGHEAEILQKLSDPLLSECPACSRETLRKRISAAGFQLKGSGWYKTDFRDGGAKPAGKKDEQKPAATEAKTEPAKAGSAPACGQGACAACATD